jgi:hypothetical protein
MSFLAINYRVDAASATIVGGKAVVALAAGTVRRATAANERCLGVAAGGQFPNGTVDVVVYGQARMRAAGTINPGDYVGTNADGDAVAVAYTGHTHTENQAATYTQNATTASSSPKYVLGIALTKAVAGEEVSVFVTPITLG